MSLLIKLLKATIDIDNLSHNLSVVEQGNTKTGQPQNGRYITGNVLTAAILPYYPNNQQSTIKYDSRSIKAVNLSSAYVLSMFHFEITFC